MEASPRIAFVDIETAPNLAWVWGKYEQDVLAFEAETYLLSFSVKWFGKRRVDTKALPDFPGYKRDKTNDRQLVKALWKVFDEADIIVAHNGDAFDVKKSNARFIFRQLKPPSHYQTIDTLKIARRHFSFNSNKLDDLAKTLSIGRKVHTGGFKLWYDCMRGDRRAWALMKKYNAQDVILLEKVYLKLRPWASNHPNIAIYQNTHHACPKCGKKKLRKRGFQYSKTSKRQSYFCGHCFSSHSIPIKKTR